MQRQGWAIDVQIVPGARPWRPPSIPPENVLYVVPIADGNRVDVDEAILKDFGTLPEKFDVSRGYFYAARSGAPALGYVRTEAPPAELAALFNEAGGGREQFRVWLPLGGASATKSSDSERLADVLTAIELANITGQAGWRIIIASEPLDYFELMQLRAQAERAAGREPVGVADAVGTPWDAMDGNVRAALDHAARLVTGLRPPRENGRISTRLILFALLERHVLPPSSDPQDPFTAVRSRLTEPYQAVRDRHLAGGGGPFPLREAVPPVIFNRDAEALFEAAAQAAEGRGVGVPGLLLALLDQAARVEPYPTAARQTLDEMGVDPAVLRTDIADALRSADRPAPRVLFRDPEPDRPDTYVVPINDAPNSKSNALRSRAEAVALARVAALAETQTPLAIGIFGDWGAGKTSFMQAIQDEVAELKKHGAPYHADIVQIEFNAWHYIETNLWASLVSHIFEDLHRQTQGDLLGVLRTPREVRIATARQFLLAHQEAEQSKNAHQDVLTQPAGAQPINMQTLKQDALKRFKDSLTDDERRHLDAALASSGLSDITTAAADAQTLLGNLALIANVVRRRWREAPATLLLLVLPVVVAACVVYAGKNNGSFGLELLGWLGGIGSVVTGAAKPIREANRWANLLIRADKAETEIEQAARRAALEPIEQRIAAAEKAKAEAKAAFLATTPMAALTQFIRSKAADEAYSRHLGLVSSIRRDFRDLSAILLSGKEPDKLENAFSTDEWKILTEEKIVDASAVAAPSGCKRIVLYIDDLDRCPYEKVVEVLQAVHLLLAFELFVVVVAVDSRWVQAALKRVYPGLSGGEFGAEPMDYLEKIFQIPYRVRSLDADASQRVLDDLLRQRTRPQTGAAGSGASGRRGEDETDTTVGSARDATAGPGQSNDPAADDPADKGAGSEHRTTQPPPNHEAPPPRRFEPITISDDESALIRILAPQAGRTPRQLKRFYNTYRVIKASLEAEEDAPPFRLILPLLAMATTSPDAVPATVDANFVSTLGLPDSEAARSCSEAWNRSSEQHRDRAVRIVRRFSFLRDDVPRRTANATA